MGMLHRLARLFLEQGGAVGETKINVVVLINLAACRANFHKISPTVAEARTK